MMYVLKIKNAIKTNFTNQPMDFPKKDSYCLLKKDVVLFATN